jgi:hypothetical protein
MNQKVKRAVWGKLLLVSQFALFCALLVGNRDAGAQTPRRSFSADVVETMGKKVTNEKIYSSEQAVRVEKVERGKLGVNITRLDRKAVWTLFPEQKMYMDMGSLGQGSVELAASVEGAKVEREPLGSEQVGAYQCDKYRVRTTYEGQVYTSLEWDAKELGGFPVKQADEKGGWSKEYKNIRLGPQDPSLFEIPADYKKVDFGSMIKPRS